MCARHRILEAGLVLNRVIYQQPISLETFRAHFWLHNSLSQQGHLDVGNFVVISFNFLPLQHMKRPALQNKRVGVLRMAFRDLPGTGLWISEYL